MNYARLFFVTTLLAFLLSFSACLDDDDDNDDQTTDDTNVDGDDDAADDDQTTDDDQAPDDDQTTDDDLTDDDNADDDNADDDNDDDDTVPTKICTTMDSGVTGIVLESIWGSGPSDIYAVGEGYILHYDGSAWSAKPMSNRYFTDVWGSSASNVYAVSDYTVLRFNGSVWLPALISQPYGIIYYGVTGTSESDVYVVGNHGYFWETVALQYNGTNWKLITELDNRSDSPFFYRAWCPNPGELWAVGGWIFQNRGFVENYQNEVWSGVDYLDNKSNALDIWGAAPDDIYVVGGGWNFGKGDDRVGGYVYHYDGADWSAMEIGPNMALFGVWGSSTSDVYAVGYNGTILHYNGSNWTRLESGVSTILRGVWGSGPNEIFAVGDDGTILHCVE